jgi:hypothetical protein
VLRSIAFFNLEKNRLCLVLISLKCWFVFSLLRLLFSRMLGLEFSFTGVGWLYLQTGKENIAVKTCM